MKIHNGIDSIPALRFPVVTSGTFDGVHQGHQKIIERVNQLAQKYQGESVLITLWPHPKHILFPEDESLKILTSFEEKAKILDALHIDHLVRINFTREFSQLSSETFIQKILVEKLHTKILVIGYDHRFGRNREGSFEYLQSNAHQYGFSLEEIPRQDVENIGVSSTKIRKALLQGAVNVATRYLGRYYVLAGKVVAGNQLGRQLGFPTANIQPLHDKKLIPADGIYAVKVKYADIIYDGMLSIGIRPTVGGTERTIEVNIFDFNQTIYNQDISIYFIERYRDELKFENLEALKAQLQQDWIKAKEILASHPNPKD
ncbi:MAG: bifunctional riboflavin kinase/FAD synthetase [Candidatus Cyclobacteriaceae bacterium M3_2C_046]